MCALIRCRWPSPARPPFPRPVGSEREEERAPIPIHRHVLVRLVGFLAVLVPSAIHHGRISMEQKTGEILRNHQTRVADGGFGYLAGPAFAADEEEGGHLCRSCRVRPSNKPPGQGGRDGSLASSWLPNVSSWTRPDGCLVPVSRPPPFHR